jgi:hypothetical protein
MNNSIPCFCISANKAVVLSEALRRSMANSCPFLVIPTGAEGPAVRLDPSQLQGTSHPPPLPSREPVTFSCFCISPNKARHPERSASQINRNKGLYGAESKDLGDACWQLLSRAFRPQTTTEDKSHQRCAIGTPSAGLLPDTRRLRSCSANGLGNQHLAKNLAHFSYRPGFQNHRIEAVFGKAGHDRGLGIAARNNQL